MEEKIEQLCNIILKLDKNVEILKNKVDNIENKNFLLNNKSIEKKEINNKSISEFKKIKVDLTENEIQSALEKHSIASDFSILYSIYFNCNKLYYPIRYISKNNYQYWSNNNWNDDKDGKYIKKICIDTLQSCYLRFNKYEKYIDNNDIYIKNQEYISSITHDEKYKTRLLNKITECIK